MDISSLPAGSRCLVDANILIYHLDELSPDCKAFLTRVARREVEAHLTTVIIAEVLHRQMLTEAINTGVVTAGQPLKKLKANPHLISGLSDYVSKVEKLLTLPWQVNQVTEADITASHALRRTHGLFVNDSINLACAERLGIIDVVSHDRDFNRVSTISVWRPMDV